MASTPTIQLVNGVSTAGGSFGVRGYINYDSVSRSNNIVTFNGVNGGYTITGSSGYWFSGYEVIGKYEFPDGTLRDTKNAGSGTFTTGDNFYSTERNFSISVSANATTVNVQNYASIGGTGGWGSVQSMAIPSLGAPSLTSQSVSNIGIKSATINYSAAAGTNATFTSCRLDYGTSASFGTSQTKTTTSGAFALSDLSPGQTYYYRFVVTNGGGKTTTSSTYTFTTLPVAGMLPILMELIK